MCELLVAIVFVYFAPEIGKRLGNSLVTVLTAWDEYFDGRSAARRIAVRRRFGLD